MEKVLIFFLIQENMKEVGLIINWKEYSWNKKSLT